MLLSGDAIPSLASGTEGIESIDSDTTTTHLLLRRDSDLTIGLTVATFEDVDHTRYVVRTRASDHIREEAGGFDVEDV